MHDFNSLRLIQFEIQNQSLKKLKKKKKKKKG
jgi:hypothetical protein